MKKSDDLQRVTASFGSREFPLLTLIDDWSARVERMCRGTLPDESPGIAWGLDDYIGSLWLRSAIDESLRADPDSGPPTLLLADWTLFQFTIAAPELPAIARVDVSPPERWWTRIMRSGPAYDEFERALQERERIRRAEQPLLDALRQAGCTVTDVRDIKSIDDAVLELLLAALGADDYDSSVKREIGYTLAAEGGERYWSRLVEIFQHVATQSGAALGLAQTLDQFATAGSVQDLLPLVMNRNLFDREWLISAVARLGNFGDRQQLQSLLDDPQVSGVVEGELEGHSG